MNLTDDPTPPVSGLPLDIFRMRCFHSKSDAVDDRKDLARLLGTAGPARFIRS